ncbi:MAG: hypothetical protein ACXW2T_04510 [Allosphingosinicella sp.]
MAGLFLVRDSDPDFANEAIGQARAQFAANGFADLSEHRLSGWRLLRAHYIVGGPETFIEMGDDRAAVAGTLTFDGLMGRPALQKLLSSLDLPTVDWSRLGGQFTLLVRRSGRTFLLTDYFAAFQLFHDGEPNLFSTSLLAAVNALPRVSFDTQGVYEFAFNVVPIGNDTVFAELKSLDPRKLVELTKDGALFHDIAKPLPENAMTQPQAERIAAHREQLSKVVRAHVGHFGDKVHCPLSGGLDSRLVLAALRAEGCTPSIYVYGSPRSSDVKIAQQIGAAQGFAVEWLDKEAMRQVTPEEFPAFVARNFAEYDGLPNYGELFENGSNGDARNARHRGGAMSASGGCGEIYRNFFYLPNRRFSAAAVARTFFARYAKTDVTARFDERAFLRSIENKIAASLDREGDRSPLPRALIEQVYPRVRCRALFGREISLESRFGAYLMPFLDQQLVAEAMRLPLELKNSGVFEAQLLCSIDPELARLPSAYGHDFAGPPDWRHRLSEWSTRVRPIALRQRSYALRRRLGPVADEHGGLLGAEYMGRVVDLEFPVMRQFFRTDRITDSGMMRRIANLEYFADRLGSRLAA